jgi:hypothetical protein
MTFGVYVFYHFEWVHRELGFLLRHFTGRDFELCLFDGVRENIISKASDRLSFSNIASTTFSTSPPSPKCCSVFIQHTMFNTKLEQPSRAAVAARGFRGSEI